LAALLAAGTIAATPAAEPPPLRLAVMDPLAADLSCPCVEGHAQRDYRALASRLEDQLDRPLQLVFAESIGKAHASLGTAPDLVIGKHSVVAHDLDREKLDGRPIAALTDKSGRTTLRGLFVVRADSTLARPGDLSGRKILFGPADAAEKHRAALDSLARAGVTPDPPLATSEGCNVAAVAVEAGEADAAVISDYAMPVLEGCGNVDEGSLKVIGSTDPVPFITVWATATIDTAAEQRIVSALESVAGDPGLCRKLESARGFVATTWPCFRGPGQDGLSDHLPARLPDPPVFLWRQPATACGVAGIAVSSRFVIVPDKSSDDKNDLFRCLDANDGSPVWSLEYPAPGEMDYGNAPRATPLVAGNRVFLLGAFGHLHCVNLESGSVVWKRNLAQDFATEPPIWGYCAPPALVDGLLIVNPGAKDASIVALDPATGKTIWQTPGEPAAYAAFTVTGQVMPRQVVGFDAKSIGGWEVASGRRLWTLTAEHAGDFNVPSAVATGRRLFLASENNGARIHAWDDSGRPNPSPLGTNQDMTPDTCTPVLVGGRIFAAGLGALVCLDAGDQLRTIWRQEEDAFDSHSSLIAGNERVLVLTTYGELILLDAGADRFQPVSRFKLTPSTETWSHPAIVPGRLYLRTQSEILCLGL
jgi:outer membrane protein assembly factor BamB/ABC-type phosphate/phosphonate transport system substrate-binding protein